MVVLTGGSGTPFPTTGLDLAGGNSIVKGLVIDHFQKAIRLTGKGNNTVSGNFLGTDVTGATFVGGGTGVSIEGGLGHMIVEPPASERNVISGNATGVYIHSNAGSGNVIEGNFLGTDLTGTKGPGTSDVQIGIEIDNSGNTVGGTSSLVSGKLAGRRQSDFGQRLRRHLRGPNGKHRTRQECH